ncbi:uncharacterized protein F4822DRAFT_378185 [Hypoxylon trugodes]|uniref:uncharacterized protein n=1 Tax=Hypoxylon trugodes TaxID=326681 RepID=UPI0021A1A8D2|nr:uncharacterized protein F4822DRAFT_378185 [Hypoxylon trugodes]KAI1384938.1 hypothetical protein F4822DRAFT_378185 [Hypoxylon trugodes]
MSFLWGQRKFSFGARQEYSRVIDASRNSSETSQDSLLGKEIEFFRREPSFWKRNASLIVANSLLFVVYIAILVAVASYVPQQCRQGPNLIISPAYEALEWEEYTFQENSQLHGPFSGYPRPEIDENWDKLLDAENIILEPEVLRHYDREDLGVAVPEGGGYLGTLNVYHELHCIKRLWQYMYPEHYWSDLSDAQREVNRLHNEHCLDFLRQSSMCHADIGLITFQWSPDSRIPVANATTHQCAKWDKIDKWTKARTVDMMKPGWLVHPTKGPSFPLGEGNRLGAVRKPQEPHLVGHESHEGHARRGH